MLAVTCQLWYFTDSSCWLLFGWSLLFLLSEGQGICWTSRCPKGAVATAQMKGPVPLWVHATVVDMSWMFPHLVSETCLTKGLSLLSSGALTLKAQTKFRNITLIKKEKADDTCVYIVYVSLGFLIRQTHKPAQRPESKQCSDTLFVLVPWPNYAREVCICFLTGFKLHNLIFFSPLKRIHSFHVWPADRKQAHFNVSFAKQSKANSQSTQMHKSVLGDRTGSAKAQISRVAVCLSCQGLKKLKAYCLNLSRYNKPYVLR